VNAMPSASKKDKVLATFTYPMRVEVHEVAFEPLDSVALLDFARLSKGRHKVAIGFASGDCCRRSVYAMVNNGMVTNIEFERCGHAKKPSKKMLALIEAARRKIGMAEPSPWRPIPVAEFFSSPKAVQDITITWGNWCIRVCIDYGDVITCYQCCASPLECSSQTIAGKL
jgi:hypothetical protein